MIEEWRTIEGYEDYQVSNLGRVKSSKYKTEKILTPNKNKIKGGYLYVTLCKGGRKQSFQIHRLVAKAFMPNSDDFILEINHIDRPSKEDLLNLIKLNPFTKVGEMFGVTDNTIRKWCKNYGLPSTRNELKGLS